MRDTLAMCRATLGGAAYLRVVVPMLGRACQPSDKRNRDREADGIEQ
jgi:hypothetical protein